MIFRSHRGGAYYTPENTMPAFRAALGIANVNCPEDVREAMRLGADIIEG